MRNYTTHSDVIVEPLFYAALLIIQLLIDTAEVDIIILYCFTLIGNDNNSRGLRDTIIFINLLLLSCLSGRVYIIFYTTNFEKTRNRMSVLMDVLNHLADNWNRSFWLRIVRVHTPRARSIYISIDVYTARKNDEHATVIDVLYHAEFYSKNIVL